MAAKVEDPLQRELSCLVCLELYSVPLLLPCGHSFCKGCLEDMREKLKEGKADEVFAEKLAGNAPAKPVEYDPNKLNCPTCRQEVKLDRRGLDSLVRNFLLDSIIEQYKSACVREGKKVKHREEVVWCGACEKEPRKANKSCTVCKLSYCEKCLPVFHPNRGGFATHRMIPATNSPTPGVISCPDHEGETMKMYCVSCRKPICYLCDRFGGHQSHQVSEIKTVFSGEKDFLEKEAKGLSDKNKILIDFIKKLEDISENIKKSGKEMDKTITDEFKNLHTVVDEAENRLRFETALNVHTKTKLLAEQIQKCQDILDTNIGTVEIIGQALQVEDHEPFLLSAATLRGRLTAGTTAYNNCPQNPVKVETSDPLNLDLGGLRNTLKALNLGYLPVLAFSWDSGSAHSQLQIDQQTLTSVELRSAKVTEVNNSGTSGKFCGPSFTVFGNASAKGTSGIRMWRVDIHQKKNVADTGNVLLTIGMAVHAYRHQRIEDQTYQTRLLTLQKRGKKYLYGFVSSGSVVNAFEAEKSFSPIAVVIDYNKRTLSFYWVNAHQFSTLHEFSDCAFSNQNWYPLIAIYTENLKVSLK
ncbi:E3 ubiquitin-protein ligase TRIM63-like [Ptychodera flava]|uniref:E3 ubiquitin-protein ligase TRIM63-like n=1 Tax=Ptychodera flava TaxID=63121 RepID=UPI003969F1E1